MVFSAISGWILKPFDLQVATMCGFDIMYDKPVLPSKVPQCKWITFRHDLEKIRFLENLTPTVCDSVNLGRVDFDYGVTLADGLLLHQQEGGTSQNQLAKPGFMSGIATL